MLKSGSKSFNLKTKMGNTILLDGKKKTGEKLLLKFAKRLQKSTKKNFKDIVQLAIINTTPTFKLNEQIIKKGKRKTTRLTPSFIIGEPARLMTSLKLLTEAASKTQKLKSFYESLADEIVVSSNMKSKAIDKKNELQKQILVNKRYLSKFRW